MGDVRVLRCPSCMDEANPTGNAFIEEGEWDGKSYECEGEVSKYKCQSPSCGFEFYTWA